MYLITFPTGVIVSLNVVTIYGDDTGCILPNQLTFSMSAL